MFTLEQLYLLQAGLNVMRSAKLYFSVHQNDKNVTRAIHLENLFNETFRELDKQINEY